MSAFLYFHFFAFVSSVLPIGKRTPSPSRPSGGRLALGPFAEWAAGQLSKKEPQPVSLPPPEKRFLGKEPPFLSGGPGGCAPWCSFLRLSPEKAGPPAGSSPLGSGPLPFHKRWEPAAARQQKIDGAVHAVPSIFLLCLLFRWGSVILPRQGFPPHGSPR